MGKGEKQIPGANDREKARVGATAAGWVLAAGFGDSAEAGVVAEEEVAGVERFRLEGGAVGGDEEPVVDFVAEELDAAEGGEVGAEGWVVGEGGFGED